MMRLSTAVLVTGKVRRSRFAVKKPATRGQYRIIGVRYSAGDETPRGSRGARGWVRVRKRWWLADPAYRL